MYTYNRGRRRLSRFILAACAGLFAAAARADTRVLLVGVSDYVDPNIEDPRGAKNDVAKMRLALMERLGIKSGEIHTLVGREATRDAITAQLRDWLCKNAKRESERLFYFSGHGSQRPSTDPHEGDKLDEVYCPADYVQKSGENGITDNEMGALLRPAEAANLIVIADCCHAGTATKSVGGQLHDLPMARIGATQPRYIPMPGKPAPRRGVIERGGVRSKGIAPDKSIDHVLYAACQDFDRAVSTKFRIGDELVDHGAFTYTLLKGLAGRADGDGNGAITLRELDRFVDRELKSGIYQFSQRPELRGDESRFNRPLLGAKRRQVSTELIRAGNNRMKLNRGNLDGLKPGESIQVFVQHRGIKPHLAKVEEVTSGEASIRFEEEPPREFAEATASPTPVQIAREPVRFEDVRLRVWIGFFLEGDKKAVPPEEILKAMRGVAGVMVVDEGKPQEADRLIAGEYVGDDVSVGIALRSERIVNSFRGSPREAAVWLKESMGKEYLKHQLQVVENDGGPAAIQLRVVDGRSEFLIHEEEDQREYLQLEVDVARDGHLLILTVDSLGNLAPLFPNEHHRSSKVGKGNSVRVPGDGSFSLPIRPPAGRDMIKAIWTAEEIQKEGFNTKSLDSGFKAPANLDETAELVKGLRKELDVQHTWGTKGFVPEAAGPGGIGSIGNWATSTIYIDTFEP